MTQKFPTIPWMEYFSTLLPSSITVTEEEMVVVNVPSFITDLEKLLEQTPKRVQANYVMWRAAATSVSYLNDEIRKRQLAYSTVISGRYLVAFINLITKADALKLCEIQLVFNHHRTVTGIEIDFAIDVSLYKNIQISGRTEREPRWKECVDIVSGSFSISVGALYVRKYFNEDAKKNAVEMVSNIRSEFKKILEQVSIF